MNNEWTPLRRKRGAGRLALAAVVSVLAALWLAAGADAAVINVTRYDEGNSADPCTPTSCSLRQAIQMANAGSDATDTINLPGAQGYALAGFAGSLNVTGHTVNIVGTGPSPSVIVGGGMGRVLTVQGASTDVTLTNISITGGTDPNGGGIFSSAKLTLVNSDVSGNTALGADPNAPGKGAGISIAGTGQLAVIGSTVKNNTAQGSSMAGSTGAGIHNEGGKVTVTRSLISGNVSQSGGSNQGQGAGIFNNFGGTLTVDQSVVSNNTANGGSQYGGAGGGIFNQGTATTVTASTITGNVAKGGTAGGSKANGAGIYSNNGHVVVVNSTISANTAQAGTGGNPGGNGAGIFGQSTQLELTDVTLSGNQAPGPGSSGGSLYMNGGTVSFRDTIVASGLAVTGSNCFTETAAPVTATGRNLESTDQCGLAAGDIKNADPLLGPLQDNGGATPTQALLAGSPAIDAAPVAGCQAADQRGVGRPQGTACDIGAYEVGVTPAGTPPPGSDVVAPLFLSASLDKVWAVNTRGRAEVQAAARRRVKRGARFRYALSEPSRVKVTIQRATKGRKVGRACRRQTRRNRSKHACVRYVSAGSFIQQGSAGKNVKPFSGRIGKKRLRPGTYRATLVATDAAGNRSLPKRLKFRIVRP
ncbi:MAG: hypothetical protein QOF37_2653 [Thermoleophilaceae bacterium]|nr:hypothetical protein [Thermoleophilaceae bacterium]